MTSTPLAHGVARRRILVATNPFLGHFLPLVPLAQELQANGHEVVVASEPAFGANVAGHGLAHVPIGRDLSLDDVLAAMPDVLSIPAEQQDAYARPRMFVALRAHNVVADLSRVVETFAPDLVLRESAEFASWALAERASLPHVAVALGAGESAREWGGLADPWFARLGERVGLDGLDATSLYRYGVLSFAPAGYLDWSGTRGARAFRPGGGSVGEHFEQGGFGDRPVVYATMGTEFFDAAVMTRIVAGIGAAGAAAVVTTGASHDPSAIATSATPLVARRWIDQETVLPCVDAVVTHGGAGTVGGALCHGLPLVVVPQGADQFAHARRVEELGVGVAVARSAPESAIAAALTAVLRDAKYRDAALEIARATALLPGVDAAARAVEQLVLD